MEIETALVTLMFASFIGLLFTGFPVGYSLAGIAVLFAGIGYLADEYMGAATGLDYLTLGLVVNRIYKIMDNWILVALPMFIFMGHMLDRSGVAERMMDSLQSLFGRARGGLAAAVVTIGVILAASTGIIGASVVLLAVISLPLMLRQGYSPALASGTVAAAGTLGILLPPSIMLILMADQLGLSVGDLFVGAVLPGLLLGGLYIAYTLLTGFLNPRAAPAPANALPLSWRAAGNALRSVLPAAFLIVAVLGSIFAGVATPTEASGIGALGAILLAAFYGRFSLRALAQTARETYKTTANIFGIFVGASAFALVLRELGGDQVIEDALTALPFGKYGIVIFILLLVFFLGFFLDWIEITLIVLPLMAPIVESLGFDINGHGVVDFPDLLWFVMLVAIALQTSFLTPPVGFALFYLKSAAPPEILITDIYRGIAPFVFLQLLVLALVVVFPQLVVWLPAVVYG